MNEGASGGRSEHLGRHESATGPAIMKRTNPELGAPTKSQESYSRSLVLMKNRTIEPVPAH